MVRVVEHETYYLSQGASLVLFLSRDDIPFFVQRFKPIDVGEDESSSEDSVTFDSDRLR